MNEQDFPEKYVLTRRSFLYMVTASLTTACTANTCQTTLVSKETPSPTVTKPPTLPEKGPTPVPTPTVKEPIATVTSVPAKGMSKEDLEIQRQLQQAKNGEVLQLKNALIGYIIRSPWFGGPAIISTLDTQEDVNFKRAAVILSSDCIFDALRAENKLPNPIGPGVWRPNIRIKQLTASVSSEYSVVMPRPILEAKSINYMDKVVDCREEQAIDQLREFVKGINWEDIPENIGEALGAALRQFIQGLRRGLGTSTP